MDDKSKGNWMGKPLESMTKSELIEAVIFISEKYGEVLETHRKDLTVLQGLSAPKPTKKKPRRSFFKISKKLGNKR